ncbi:thioesterase family protein [Croceicoccus sp. YJ47]|uniref:thioesterase family protein n=1 Tax=Croceicoccus sp. YJ47 TaxID=2798724 RepID=UPI0019231DA2|nr:thioesterase family protein [Croceicoccus sp. YJ47]QQN75363.1 thioesterase family protein [Croceicoccus sp. YJ47]
MQTPNLARLLDAALDDAGTLAMAVPEGWTQGRTAYGGLSTAAAYCAARSAGPDLPPLRSAQIAFAGPISGTVRAEARMLRRGRSSAFVTADLHSGDAAAWHGTFLFTATRDSSVLLKSASAPFVVPPEEAPATRRQHAPAFTQHFDYADASPGKDGTEPMLRHWVRLRDRGGLDPFAELLLVGDALPPGALTLMKEPGPVSSAMWSIDLLVSEPRTRDGWWLLETRTDQAEGGMSTQSMAIWNADGEPVAIGSQTVSIFA